ncbi:MAG: hypothetical protein ACYDEJ_04295 [Desulfitobacteriaceae bacterium]
MPRHNGNKERKEEINKIKLTLQNIEKAEEFLNENADELTPHQIKDVQKHLNSKKKFIVETEGTIK